MLPKSLKSYNCKEGVSLCGGCATARKPAQSKGAQGRTTSISLSPHLLPEPPTGLTHQEVVGKLAGCT